MFTTLLQYLSDKQGGTQQLDNICNTIDWSRVKSNNKSKPDIGDLINIRLQPDI